MKNIRINNPRKNYYTVVADTNEFGINEVVFEGISLEECIAYIKANTKAQKKPLWAVGVETERTHRRHYVVVRSRDASTAWNQVYRHGYNNGYLCVDRINISAESLAITPAAEQEQEAPAETEQATEEATTATDAAQKPATTATEAAPLQLETLSARLDRMTAAELVELYAATSAPGSIDDETDSAIYDALKAINPRAYRVWMMTSVEYTPGDPASIAAANAADVERLRAAYGITA